MAPLPHLLNALLRREASTNVGVAATAASAMEATMHQAAKRATAKTNFGSGARPASEFNNQGFLALFALIGAGMVIGSIWFFFWAKNGGFKWRQHDWDDYKSTVLRRKGPDGRTLSNATKSTRLGGGSVVHGGSYGAPTSVGYTDSSSVMEEKEQQRRAGEGIRGGDGRKKSRKNKDPELAGYRHEKPARVGGINRAPDGTHYDYSNTEPSELGSELSQRPLVKDTKPKDKKAAKKEAEAREKELRKAQKEAAKVQKAKLAENKKREKEKAKEMKKNKGTTDRSYSPAAPDSPTRRTQRRYEDEVTEFTEATSYTGGYTATEDAYTDVYTNNDSYYSAYRPHAEPNLARPAPAARSYDGPSSPRHHSSRRSQSRTRQGSSRQSSPRKQGSSSRHHSRSRRNSRYDVGGSSVTGDSDQGTKVYSHHIPGLSGPAAPPTILPDESISQVGAPGRRGRNVMDGYRRAGMRSRRDSLSDSE